MEPITSRQNPQFKKLRDLHNREEREKRETFLVEGEKEIALAKEIETLYYAELTPFVKEMKKKAREAFCMAPELLENISYRGASVVAICPQIKHSWEEMKKASLLLLCESVEKPGNLGAMFRTADGAGIGGIIVADPLVDVFNPNVVRASLGALFSVPFVQTEAKLAKKFLFEQGFQVVVTSPYAKKSYYEVDFTKPTCIVIGSEAKGLSEDWLSEGAFTPVTIPMRGSVDSLNASMSAGIVIYEAVRQRSSLS